MDTTRERRERGYKRVSLAVRFLAWLDLENDDHSRN